MPVLFIALFVTTAAFARQPDTARHATHFLLKDETGKTLNVAAQKGKVLFLNFWALSCAPCKAELPSINRLQQHYGNDTNVLILPIDLDSDHENSPKYMREKGFSLSVYNAASVVPEAYFHGKLPTTVVIDKAGRVVLVQEEEGDYDTPAFLHFIDSLQKK